MEDKEVENHEPIQQPPTSTTIKFLGEGSRYFGIAIVNAILTILTLGLYYPWAKANIRKYMWNETEIKGSRFVFHGTGREMFKGFVIAYIILGTLYLGLFWSQSHPEYALYFILAFYIAIFFLAPLAIFGAWRYRVSRTSWRGIYFGFDGKFREFAKLFFVQLFFTIITFGIYTSWMRVKIMNYLFSHTQLGKNKFEFKGDGGELFGITLLGVILSYVTLGIYLPFFIKNRINFTIDNTIVNNGEVRKRCLSTLKGKEAFSIMFVNLLLIVFTLGIAFPWVAMRNMKMVLENIVIPNNLDFDNLDQSENNYKNATGDELVDILDIGLDF